MGTRVDYRCWEIIDEPEDIEPGQLSICDTDDTDLDFKPLGYVTETPEEIAYRCLVKDQKARVLDLWSFNNIHVKKLPTITTDPSASMHIAINASDVASLSIGDDTGDVLVIGTGSFDGAHSLVAVNASYLGVQNGGHTEENFNYGLCIGQGIDADGEYNVITGAGHDVDGNITRVHGQNISLTESYIDAFGVQLTGSHQHARLSGIYAKSIAEGSDCRSFDRYGVQDGNLQRVVLDLVGVTNGDTGHVTLRARLAGTGPSFTLDDGTIAYVKVTLFSAIKNATNAITDGYRIDHERGFTCWYNDGYTVGNAADSFSAITNNFTPTMSFFISPETGNVSTSNGAFIADVNVTSNTNSDVIVHRAKVEIITAPTSFISSS